MPHHQAAFLPSGPPAVRNAARLSPGQGGPPSDLLGLQQSPSLAVSRPSLCQVPASPLSSLESSAQAAPQASHGGISGVRLWHQGCQAAAEAEIHGETRFFAAFASWGALHPPRLPFANRPARALCPGPSPPFLIDSEFRFRQQCLSTPGQQGSRDRSPRRHPRAPHVLTDHRRWHLQHWGEPPRSGSRPGRKQVAS